MHWTYEVSEFCNMACTYCNVNINDSKVSTTEQFKDFYKDNLKDSDEYSFGIIGGEPFLQTSLIFDICKILNNDSKCLRINIPTNGTIFNNDIVNISNIKKVNITISHDGIHHDLNRGTNKIFLKEFQDIGIVKTHNMLVGENFYKNSNFLVRNHLYLEALNAIPDMTIVRDIESFNNEQVYYFLEDYLEYSNFVKDRILNNHYKKFNDIPKLIQKYLSVYLEYGFYGYKKNNCGAGISYFAIKPNMDILPCVRFSREPYLLDSFNKGDHLRIMSVCDTCSIRDICDKGCLYEHIKNGRVIPELCDLYKGIFKILKEFVRDLDYKILKLFEGK